MASVFPRGAATVADLYQVAGKAELVDGNLVRMPPTGGRPGYAAGEVFVSLHQHARVTGVGTAIGDNIGFLVHIPGRRSFSPDAAYWTGPEPTMRFYSGAPIFAVEIRSENDYGHSAERLMATKRADYFLAGTEVVWDIDLEVDQVIRSYRRNAPDNVQIFERSDIAHAEPALMGWTLAVDRLFW